MIDIFKYKWEVLPCGTGDDCWCRLISIVTDEEIEANDKIIVGSAAIDEEMAHYIVKLHNQKFS